MKRFNFLLIVSFITLLVIPIFAIFVNAQDFTTKADGGDVGFIDLDISAPKKTFCETTVTTKKLIRENLLIVECKAGNDKLQELKVNREFIGQHVDGPEILVALNDDEGPLTDCGDKKGCNDKPTTLGVAACWAECAVIVLEDCTLDDCDFDD